MSLARLVLASGRAVHLAELCMSSAYGGPLESYPCKPLNDHKIRWLLRSAEQACPGPRCTWSRPRARSRPVPLTSDRGLVPADPLRTV